jgi:hypothetical protein
VTIEIVSMEIISIKKLYYFRLELGKCYVVVYFQMYIDLAVGLRRGLSPVEEERLTGE